MPALDGRRALVGGASQGIGAGCAHALAANGASVTLLARNEEALAEVRDALPTPTDQDHGYLAVDFSTWADVREAAAADVAANGPVTVLVNNTGGPAAGPIRDAEPDSFAAAFEQHVLVNRALVEVVLPGMIEAGYGRVINIISTSVVTPIAGLGVSNTIRGAVANWGRTLASELGPHGITVNNVLPGYIDTERLATSLGRRAESAGTSVEEISEAIPQACMGRGHRPPPNRDLDRRPTPPVGGRARAGRDAHRPG